MPAKYRLSEKMFIRVDGHLEAALHEAGEEIEFSEAPHRNMIPLNDEAKHALASVLPLTASGKNIAPRRGDPV